VTRLRDGEGGRKTKTKLRGLSPRANYNTERLPLLGEVSANWWNGGSIPSRGILFPIMSRLTLEPGQPPIQWVLRAALRWLCRGYAPRLGECNVVEQISILDSQRTHRRRYEDNIKTDLRRKVVVRMDWIQLLCDSAQWLVFVNSTMNSSYSVTALISSATTSTFLLSWAQSTARSCLRSSVGTTWRRRLNPVSETLCF
jgi:hypothetical protein